MRWREIENDMRFRVIEWLIVITLVVIGLLFRFQHIDLETVQMDYYQMAYVAGDNRIPRLDSLLETLYVYMLHVMLLFFGNKVAVGVWTQVGLQLLAMLVIYCAAKKITAVPIALALLLYMDFSPGLLSEASRQSYMTLFMLLWGIGLMAIAYAENSPEKPGRILLAGVIVGAVACFDVFGAVLFVLLSLTLCLSSNAENLTAGEKAIRCMYSFLSAIVGIVLLGTAELLLLDKSVADLPGTHFRIQVLPWEIYTTVVILAGLIMIAVLNMHQMQNAGFRTIGGQNMENDEKQLTDESPIVEKKTNFIDNPMYIPKRRKKPTLDFDLEDMKGMDFYDVKVAPDDDYDF